MTASICLIIPPSVFLLDERVFMSLGILRIAAVLENAGYSVDVLDLSGVKNYEEVVQDYITSTPIRTFGLTATTPQIPAAGKIQLVLRRQLPEARIILGGPHTTLVHAAFKNEYKRGMRGRATEAFQQLQQQYDVLVPGDGELAIFDSIFADIGDNQSIERSVSTFSSHMGRVIKILLEATPNSLILLDELGTGTDPEEGSALARSVLAHAVENSIPIAITSHYRNVVEYAAESEELANASVELDPTTMLPTYQVLMGIPGRSYAIHVARQLGMPNHVLDKAQSMMDPSHTEAENMLDQLHSERDEINRMRDETHSAKIKAETAQKDLQNKLSNVARAQEDMIERSRTQLRREVEDVRRNLRKIVSQGGQISLVQVYTVARPPAESTVTPLVDTEVDHLVELVRRQTGLAAQGYYGSLSGMSANGD